VDFVVLKHGIEPDNCLWQFCTGIFIQVQLILLLCATFAREVVFHSLKL